ncbi:MAG: GtrA family protein [Rikenellaceae bacterium]
MGKIGEFNILVAEAVRSVIDFFYRPPVSRFISKEVMRYGACGVGNYIVGDALLFSFIYNFIVAKRALSLSSGAVVVSPHVLSLIIVFPITFLIGFWLNRYVTFRGEGSGSAVTVGAAKQILRYGLTVCGSIVLSYVILKVLVEVVGVWPTPAKVVGSLLTAVYSYLVARLYTFRAEKNDNSREVNSLK